MEQEPEQLITINEHAVEELTESMHELEERLEKINKPSRTFVMGIVTGLGGVIGATLLVSILLGLFSWLSIKTESFPRLNTLITNISQQIND